MHTTTLNLQKLCKVWGYMKYHHPAFLLGMKSWDDEFFALYAKVDGASGADETNEILCGWVRDFGDIDEYVIKRHYWAKSPPEDMDVQADKTWLTDEAYLSAPLSAELLRVDAVDAIVTPRAPNTFWSGYSNFANESYHIEPELILNDKYRPARIMDYGDAAFRFLGLFRVWNAIEYHSNST